MGERPVILLVTDSHRATLLGEFQRYSRDYELVPATSVADAVSVVESLVHQGHQLALVAAEHDLRDGDSLDVFARLRPLVPTARRVALLAENFLAHVDRLRIASLDNELDAYLAVPKGLRDEEFHTALVETLSDWGWSVAGPVVARVELVYERPDANVAALRDWLERSGMPSRAYQADSPEGTAVLEAAGPDAELPLLRTFDDQFLSGATVAKAAEAMYGGHDSIPDDEVADVVIVGAGPAGLAAAVYAASEGLDTIVIESEAIGGQAGSSSMIRNYLGFPRGISGMRLAQRARIQALRFGAKFYTGRPVTDIQDAPPGEPTHHHVFVRGARICARAVVLAAGVAYRRLGVAALDAFLGSGVYYGAATAMAREMKGRHVVVVGGGNSAGQAALHLAKFADKVTIVVRRDGLAATMSEYLIREIDATGNVEVRTSTQVVGGGGDGRLEWLDLEVREAGGGVHLERVDAGGLCLLIGADPACDWVPATVTRDAKNHLQTGRDVPKDRWRDGHPPASLETAVPGVFAAGDIRAGSMKRVAAAAGEGATVVALVHDHLAKLRAEEFTDVLPEASA